MAVRVPSPEDVGDMAAGFSISLSDADAASYSALMKAFLVSYEGLDVITEPKRVVKFPRTSGFRPEPHDNPLNAWYWRAQVTGAKEGPLAGRTVVLKDTTCLAGVPMMNGTAVLEGYVPEFDATVAERILDAGGTIVGKAACENLSFSGGSHTIHIAPVHNPHKHGYSSGPSSRCSTAF